jgi:hypothetical protein
MRRLLYMLVGAYVLGFVVFFWMNLTIGPVTAELAFWRATFWPVWIWINVK